MVPVLVNNFNNIVIFLLSGSLFIYYLAVPKSINFIYVKSSDLTMILSGFKSL